MGTTKLKEFQWGYENTPGTAVAATTKGLTLITPPGQDREVHIPQGEIGVRADLLLDAAVVRRVGAVGLTMAARDGAYFQLFPHLFSMGLVKETPSAGGDGDYTYSFPAPMTSAVNVDTATLEVIDDSGAVEIPYSFVKAISISGDCDDGTFDVSADMVGQKVHPTTKTSGLSMGNVDMCVAKLTQVYVDGTWAGLGSTELANALVAFEINFETGLHAKWLGSDQMEYDNHGQGAIRGTAQLTFERTAAVLAEMAYYRPASGHDLTKRFLRFKTTGPLIGGSVYHTLTLDFAGLWTDWQTIGSEKEGNNLDIATMTFGYDQTGAQVLAAEVVTDLSSIYS